MKRLNQSQMISYEYLLIIHYILIVNIYVPHRFPFVAVSIAFAVNKEVGDITSCFTVCTSVVSEFLLSCDVFSSFQLEFGIVYSCLEDKMYKARKGQGAFCNDELIQVSDVKGTKVFYSICWSCTFGTVCTCSVVALPSVHLADVAAPSPWQRSKNPSSFLNTELTGVQRRSTRSSPPCRRSSASQCTGESSTTLWWHH